MKDRNYQHSKTLSYVLRHAPEKAGLTLDKEGYAPVEDICDYLNISFETLENIVATNDKKRFAFNSDQTKIRASQGHSLEQVQIKMEALTTVPTVLYHGTKKEFLPLILKEGLNKMSRNHVHLSGDEITAKKVADRRKGESIILQINAFAMRGEGYKFYLSENNVYLTDSVPAKFIKHG